MLLILGALAFALTAAPLVGGRVASEQERPVPVQLVAARAPGGARTATSTSTPQRFSRLAPTPTGRLPSDLLLAEQLVPQGVPRLVAVPVPPPAAAPPPPLSVTKNSRRRSQAGKASWYQTHDGTCAHVKLPKGTVVRVVNIATGQETACRVADRGPFLDGRVVDLDVDVFIQIAGRSQGVIDVRIFW